MQPHVAPFCRRPSVASRSMSSRSMSSRHVRRGFTLVELLVVIMIIGILIALLSTAVASAMTTAREASVLAEINGLSAAMLTYKTDNGGVPPDFSPYDPGTDTNWSADVNYQAVFIKHLNRRFPNSVIFNYPAVQIGIQGAYGLDVARLDPAEALVFWLGGFSDVGSGRLLGFNADKTAPLNPSTVRTDPLYDFDTTRLFDQDGDGWFEYYPDDPDTSAPYVYFASRGDQTYGTPGVAMYPHVQGNTLLSARGYAVPYYQSATAVLEPRGFQIIAAGVRDNSYSGDTVPRTGVFATPFFPAGQGFAQGDFDNLTNFHTGSLDKGLD